VTALTFSVEVITVPVSDVDRALRFYKDQLGFHLDVDYSPKDGHRVGSVSNVYLVVPDLEATSRLLERHVAVNPIRHKTPVGAWDGGFAPGFDPARGDYASFASFPDPDGNRWVLQQRGYRNA
jgi:catechol 2,3-dioxygenase-like lactoylglutathione lyase family enzyme